MLVFYGQRQVCQWCLLRGHEVVPRSLIPVFGILTRGVALLAMLVLVSCARGRPRQEDCTCDAGGTAVRDLLGQIRRHGGLKVGLYCRVAASILAVLTPVGQVRFKPEIIERFSLRM